MTRVGEAAQLIESHGSDWRRTNSTRVHIGLSVSPQDDDFAIQTGLDGRIDFAAVARHSWPDFEFTREANLSAFRVGPPCI